MSDSTDNTNELDSYGVWVKNTNQEGAADDDLNFADSLDLPDFEETGDLDDSSFEDMFKDDDTINLDPSADDTTLTDDELMNITSGDGIEIAEESGDSFEENTVSDADLSDFDTEITDTQNDELSIPEVSIEEPGDTEDQEDVSLDDFDFDKVTEEEATAPAAEETIPETEETTSDEISEEVSADEFGLDSEDSDSEQEISLDDFMDQGFSDESVASGNNGFAADEVPSGDSEEVSLDDFVDMSEFGVTEEAPKKEEAISDEKPLDMDISFDASADTVETEENYAANDSSDDSSFDDDDEIDNSTFATKEVSDTEEQTVTGSNDIEAEEVDLSDFGIDANAEETPVTQDVESAKNKETVVDYDLSVENDNASAAPVVNEIKSSAPIEEIEEVSAVEVSNSDSGLLQQIVADLSSLKEEINTLKSNLEEIKANPASSGASGFISEEIAVEDEEVIPDSSKEDTGFFSGDDGDDTIALSTDELSNILNTADFNTEEEAAADNSEEAVTEDFVEQEPAVEETFVEETVESEPVVEETFTEEPAAEESVTENFVMEDPVVEASPDEENMINNFEAPAANDDEPSFDFENENLSEPNIDEIEIDEESLEDDLPDEITIAKDDDILVESSSSDFMDSVQDTTEEHEEAFVEEAPVPAEEPVIEEPDAFSTVDNLFDETAAEPEITEESGFADIEVEEPQEDVVQDETFVSDEEVTQDMPVISEPVNIENDFVSHEEDNNDLTDSNIDYLTTEDKEAAEESTDENAELKKDIKSVLLYMDQLLENLPEEKIVEFAKSEEFTTYKKLFSELGLS